MTADKETRFLSSYGGSLPGSPRESQGRIFLPLRMQGGPPGRPCDEENYRRIELSRFPQRSKKKKKRKVFLLPEVVRHRKSRLPAERFLFGN